MMVRYDCYVCGAGLESDEKAEGQTETCPSCKTKNVVPYKVYFVPIVSGEFRAAGIVGDGKAIVSPKAIVFDAPRHFWPIGCLVVILLTTASFFVGRALNLPIVPSGTGWLILVLLLYKYARPRTVSSDPKTDAARFLETGVVLIELANRKWVAVKAKDENRSSQFVASLRAMYRSQATEKRAFSD
jgi:DNA-directed RNA polymerase subunit RPC12/RpoP